MSTTIAPLRLLRPPGLTERPSDRRRDRRAERRRLEQQDALSAHLAELHSIHEVLARAAALVGDGWLQGAWFAVSTPTGERRVTAHDLRLLTTRPVTRSCLVGAVVQAGGGPAAVTSQTVQRTLDLTWHTLREEADRPVVWCPAPAVRTLHVRELTRWNDAPRRTPDDVVHLLESAQGTVVAERARAGAGSRRDQSAT